MKIKKLGITILMIIIVMSSLFAATPSKFDVGVLNFYKIQNVIDTEFEAYTPGIRLEGHITPWFGLGLDALLDSPFSGGGDPNLVLTTDIAFRASLGFFEPYIALGPAYSVVFADSGVTLDRDVMYSGRVGFDFNITSIFTVGVESKLILRHLDAVIDGSQEVDWLESTYVGLTLKAKF